MTQSPCLPGLPKLPLQGLSSWLHHMAYKFPPDAPTLIAWAKEADALVEAGSAAAVQAVPEGFVLVPREPTLGMLVAARNWSAAAFGRPVGNAGASGCYSAMIDAAPTQGAEGAAPQAATMCPCGDRPAADCDEQWGPKCDMGNNAKHAKVYEPALQAVVGEAVNPGDDPYPAEVWILPTAKDHENLRLSAVVNGPGPHGFISPTAPKKMAVRYVLAALTPSPTPTEPQEADALREAVAKITISVESKNTNSVAWDLQKAGYQLPPGEYLLWASPRIKANYDSENASDDIVKRLRNTPNWSRETYGNWKDCVSRYDRTPFEAADEIERLRAALAQHQPQQGEQRG